MFTCVYPLLFWKYQSFPGKERLAVLAFVCQIVHLTVAFSADVKPAPASAFQLCLDSFPRFRHLLFLPGECIRPVYFLSAFALHNPKEQFLAAPRTAEHLRDASNLAYLDWLFRLSRPSRPTIAQICFFPQFSVESVAYFAVLEVPAGVAITNQIHLVFLSRCPRSA